MVIVISTPSLRRLRSGNTPSDILKKEPGTVTSSLKRSKTYTESSSSSESSSCSLSTSDVPVTSNSTSTAIRSRLNDQQRKDRLEQDLDVLEESVRPRSVQCKGCTHTIRLDTKINYGDSNWKTHKKRCPMLKKKTHSKTVDQVPVPKPLLNISEVPLEGTSKSSCGSYMQEKLSDLEYSAVLGLLAIQRKMNPSMS
ncbi:hypothetical protein GGU10DRAFT_336949 [Lentinula aff. detonsa]|uniref:Uncharacterized protein n=1 Tax=Lentinula aff. detonsa TaxID=2804958 RepID=A0AA38L2X7_9AGAR|nr:hypothetical protein GGU10DRAFT_336949 [Lentinula aff. detonsa]